MEIHERDATSHRLSKTNVVWMVWVGSPIPVTKEPVFAEGIVIRARLILPNRDRRDAQWQLADSGFEDTLRSLEWDALAVQQEPTLEDAPVQQVR